MIGEKIAHILLNDLQFQEALKREVFWKRRLDVDLLCRLFSWQELNHCLSFNRITNDRFRMSTCSEHRSLNRRAFRQMKDKFGRNTDYLVVSELHKLMREGVTAVLEAVNELSPAVCSLTERLSGELGARSTANAYMSFGNQSGFGMHNDDHDVIILQLDGCKEWRFIRNPASDKATVMDLRDPMEGRDHESIVASAGDAFYIPKGTWHNVLSMNERSLHLTVSIVYPTIADFITWSIGQEKLGVPYADIKPNGQCIERTIRRCSDFLDTIPSEANVANFLSAFYAEKRCSRTRANFPALNTARVADEFRRVPFELVTLSSSRPDRYEIYALGRIHSLTHGEYAVLTGLPRCGAIRGGDISAHGGGWESTAVILESLMDRDLVTTVRSES